MKAAKSESEKAKKKKKSLFTVLLSWKILKFYKIYPITFFSYLFQV